MITFVQRGFLSVLALIILSCSGVAINGAWAQSSSMPKPLNIDRVDTFSLSTFKAVSVVAFKEGGVTAYISQKDCLDSLNAKIHLIESWEQKVGSNEARSNPDIQALDSMHHWIEQQMLTKDTIVFPTHQNAQKCLNSWIYLAGFILSGNCAIYDEQGVRQFSIIRTIESKWTTFADGLGEGYGFWRFRFLNAKEGFLISDDWYS